ncbi:MAG TPA: hypothetical protein PLE19_19710 [Planctomycetota bacterium]|nr:hypothetical protein [Planctomycetota bacterium]HRR82625.1 hypothetical protein [Planctomycetota bacterium]HRT96407.1 hypothetical protein [Planctomycetota bacterium]
MPFHFTDHMRALMADIAATCPELRHVDMSRVAVTFAQARHARLDGVYACVRPLRFPDGGVELRRPRATYAMPRVLVGGREMLYVVEFRLPRFMGLPFEEKVATVVHEMYHISPKFDGTLRRFAGSKPYHTGSQRRYDAAMGGIARAYLAATRRPELHAFLRHTFDSLAAAHGGLVGLRVRCLNPRRVR